MKIKNDQQQKENATENKGIFATIREFFTDIAAYFSNIASKIANFFSSEEKQDEMSISEEETEVESDEISISEEEEVVVVEVAPTQEGMQTAEQQGTPVAVDTTQIGSNSTTPNVQDPNANKEASK